ncbi:MAG: acetyl-CoA carboxylase biotin carboxyl carrier protein [Planctomycetes bacterium]|nr:acetyl-CoA carboxylase biotin carboxyl carrier protein [Planctomycetota bacterium]
MDLEEIERLVKIMNDNQLSELEYEDQGRKVRLRKGSDAAVNPLALMGASVMPGQLLPASSAHPTPPSVAGAAPVPSDLIDITSPLVGTFYRSARPDAKPFVQVGEELLLDRVLCIVEAMKVMNEIKTEFDCVVREILPKNGDPVEFGQVLFRVKKK